MTTHNPVNHPKHYTAHPSGIECLDVVRHLPYELGNVIKYCWRWQNKGGVEDLRKALTYLDYCTPETQNMVGETPHTRTQAVIAAIVLRKEPKGTPLRAALELLTVIWGLTKPSPNPRDRWDTHARAVIEQTIQEQEAH